MSIADAVLDIITDLMIITIPIFLLKSVRIRAHQKLIIGVFLSLNLFMALTAAVRVSGLNYNGKFDIVWLYGWQHAEACIAVIMISLTAFRSVFVSSQSSRARREAANKPWYSSIIAAIKRRRAMNQGDEESTKGLPTIPSATLTGMRTFINGGKSPGKDVHSTNITVTGGMEPEQWPLTRLPQLSAPIPEEKLNRSI